MTKPILSLRAQADLEEIWDYTAERWGEAQAESYVGGLRGVIETLAHNPRLGRACDEIRSGYRRYSVGSHVVFFRLIDGGLEVTRILHQHMDFAQHL